jgi:hypothetical protein
MFGVICISKSTKFTNQQFAFNLNKAYLFFELNLLYLYIIINVY